MDGSDSDSETCSEASTNYHSSNEIETSEQEGAMTNNNAALSLTTPTTKPVPALAGTVDPPAPETPASEGDDGDGEEGDAEMTTTTTTHRGSTKIVFKCRKGFGKGNVYKSTQKFRKAKAKYEQTCRNRQETKEKIERLQHELITAQATLEQLDRERDIDFEYMRVTELEEPSPWVCDWCLIYCTDLMIAVISRIGLV